MRNVLAALLLILGSASAALAQVGPPNQASCNQVTLGTGAVQVATAITGRRIFVCGWSVNANVALGAFTLAAGTGTVCATNNVPISVYTALPVGVVVDRTSFAFFNPAVASNLCVTVATGIQWSIYWGQY